MISVREAYKNLQMTGEKLPGFHVANPGRKHTQKSVIKSYGKYLGLELSFLILLIPVYLLFLNANSDVWAWLIFGITILSFVAAITLCITLVNLVKYVFIRSNDEDLKSQTLFDRWVNGKFCPNCHGIFDSKFTALPFPYIMPIVDQDYVTVAIGQKIRIECKIADSKLYFNGVFVGTCPVEIEAPPGLAEFEIRAPSRLPRTLKLKVEKNEDSLPALEDPRLKQLQAMLASGQIDQAEFEILKNTL